ncbi:MAG: heparinase II/III family protein, partial [Planctomycetota bacterium]|nr:heparinase II/III family protein [Planctomycetota bacterium]
MNAGCFGALMVAALSALASAVLCAGEDGDKLPAHPRLMLGKDDIPAIKARIAKLPGAKARFESLKRQADDWLKREYKLPEKGGQWYHYYSCPKHGARLKMQSPTRHVCPIDKEVFTGYPYDDVVISNEHGALSGAIRILGLAYQLTREARYAAKAREILLAYAAKYESYPLHNIKNEPKVGGGKVGPQTLDEATWLITVVEGADCIWDTLSAAEQTKVKDGLLYPATKVIRDHRMGIHNIQCWKNSAVGLTGLLIGDMKLVDEALKAESGYYNQMKKGPSADGVWFEGAWGYHFYTLSAVSHLTEGAFHSGINLYNEDCKRLFDGPIAFAMPDLRLPAFNDSGIASVAGNAWLYEIGFARYKDPRYCAVLAQSKRDSDQALLCGVAQLPAAASAATASRNYPASGYAVLTAGQGADATWFCMKYGPHGGGHGHPDKLNFVLYALGQIVAPDPGTANYGVPIQAGWYRTTPAHNTLTVDEDSQKPAEGKCEAFVATEGFSAVMAEAGAIYPGVSFRRTMALVGGNLL